MRPNKYGNKRAPSALVGRSFDSQAERARGEELALMEKAGAIRNLRFQVTFPLVVNGVRVTSYRCDFVYEDESGMMILEETKGFRTDAYEIKRKLVWAVLGHKIREADPRGRIRSDDLPDRDVAPGPEGVRRVRSLEPGPRPVRRSKA